MNAVPELTDSGSVSNDVLYLGIGLPSKLIICFFSNAYIFSTRFVFLLNKPGASILCSLLIKNCFQGFSDYQKKCKL